ncbi:MAG: glycosyltransferase [Terracidiphilus sp.]|jgi:predicted glycosyltransferase
MFGQSQVAHTSAPSFSETLGDEMAWLKQEAQRSNSTVIWHRRFKGFLSANFSKEARVAFCDDAPLPEVIGDFIGSCPDKPRLDQGRYAIFSGVYALRGGSRGLLWVDCKAAETRAVFVAMSRSGLRLDCLEIYLSKRISEPFLPAQFLSTMHLWLRSHGIREIVGINLHDACDYEYSLNPAFRWCSMSQPRILIFTHDGRGLGHLRRLARLGKVLQQHSAVLFITGHREASWLVPPECEYIHLPNLDSLDPRRSRQWGRRPFLSDDLSVGRALRRDVIYGVIQRFRPDAIILDYLPLGMDEEMREFILGTPECRKYFISRGILGSPDQVYRDVLTPSAVESLRDAYHMILVMSDSKIIDMAQEYSLEAGIVDKIAYVGYAAEPVSSGAIEGIRSRRMLPKDAKWVVCTAGGGKEGELLIQRCWEVAQIFPECYFDIVVGPRSRLLLESEAWADGNRIHLLPLDDRQLPLMHAAADVVIIRGGYNSLIEACMGKGRIIVVPIMTDYEQVNHAKRLSEYRDIRIVESLGILDIALDDCLQEGSLPNSRFTELNMDGLHIGADVILSDLEQHRIRGPQYARGVDASHVLTGASAKR